MCSLSCQQGLTAAIASCLALAVFGPTASAPKAPSTSARASRSTWRSLVSSARPLPHHPKSNALALLSAGADESTEPLLACLAALEAILMVMKARSARKVQCTLLRHSRSTRHSPLSSARHHGKRQMRLLCCQQGLTLCA
eukprot:scaffold36295_cov126-Isochrysis_galbana.AAC.4